MAEGMVDGLVAVYRWPTFLFQRRISDQKVEDNGRTCGRISDVRFSGPFGGASAGAENDGGHGDGSHFNPHSRIGGGAAQSSYYSAGGAGAHAAGSRAGSKAASAR